MSTIPSHLETLIDRLQTTGIAIKSRLADRIGALSAAYADDYEARNLSVRSLSCLIDFLEASPSSNYPDITATPAGDIYAEWRGPQGHLLTIEFLDSGEARYLHFRPNPKHPHRTDRLSGTTTADALSETVVPLVMMTGLAA